MDYEFLRQKINEFLSSDKSDLYKKIAVMAVITKVLEELEVKPIIVGGQAVEFYTSGGYTTMDVDMVCAAGIEEINEKLSPLGFEKEGKYWILEEENIVIEVPSGPLAGSLEKVMEVEVEEGLVTYIIGIEDIIIDRLNRYKHWNVNTDKEWIPGMIYVNYDDIDWDYLLKKAREEKTEDELKEFKEIVEEEKEKQDTTDN